MSRRERLKELLGARELAWLVERMRRRLERGDSLRGRVAKSDPTREERRALDGLIGRMPSRGRRISVSFEELEDVLRSAGLCETLEQALELVCGPVENRSARREEAARGWRSLVDGALAGAGEADRPYLQTLDSSGILKRLSRGDMARASRLLEDTAAVLALLPARGVPLAELAATVTGDSHALDAGMPLSTLCLHAIAARDATERPRDAAERRDLWANQGVLCDELSAPALVLNLPSTGSSFAARALAAHREAGEPYRLTTRLLVRDPPAFATERGARDVFVCENPTVVAAAACQLGGQAAPLVCVEGQPKTAARLLLNCLATSGFTLRYHGDFDWPGIRIGNVLARRHGTLPWRFGAADYDAALPAAPSTGLEGVAVDAAWDESLRETMERRGRAIVEEAVLEALLGDLGG